MWSTGGYPLGAANDPRAPWNEKDPAMCQCPECKGKGHLYYAFNVVSRQMTEVSKEKYDALPEDEDVAYAKNSLVCQGEDYDCEVCDGTGEVELDLEDYFADY